MRNVGCILHVLFEWDFDIKALSLVVEKVDDLDKCNQGLNHDVKEKFIQPHWKRLQFSSLHEIIIDNQKYKIDDFNFCIMLNLFQFIS